VAAEADGFPSPLSLGTRFQRIPGQGPSIFRGCGPRPLYFTLREHFCYSPSWPVPLDRDENGIMNAFLPASLRWIEHEVGYHHRQILILFHFSFPPRRRMKLNCMTGWESLDVVTRLGDRCWLPAMIRL
jgi:hypothetical protein